MLAASLKQAPYDSQSLAGPRTVATIYDKPTLRTQASFAAGIAELAGNAMMVDGSLAGIGKRESVADVARVLGRQASVIVWRTYAQTALAEMAEHAGVPVINALTDEFHPCQLLADLLTIRERKGELIGLTAAFVGDGACNMGNSWLLAGATAGLRVRIAAPEGHQPEEQYVERAREIGAATGALPEVMTDPEEAVTGADIVVTDTWVSMGKEEEAADRLAAFGAYTVTARLMSLAAPDAIAMHCLPAYRGKEIDSDVLDGPQSVVWDEAENRRHAQKAIITWLLRGTEVTEEELL
jgi:ornithine carbamoyltransferase